MSKTTTWVVIVVVVVVLILGYLGRHHIKAMLSGSSPSSSYSATTTPTEQPTTQASSSPSAALNNNIVTTKTDPQKGAYLADTKGMTLYSYDKDSSGVSNCYSGCDKAWPIYTAPKSAANLPDGFTVVKRTDNTSMYAYQGKPLYYYIQDTKPGDTTGDGVGGTWHLVKP